LEFLVLRHPDYVVWMLLLQGASSPMARAREEVRHLLDVFDQKPILEACCGEGCHNRATRCTVPRRGLSVFWWCHRCDEYALGASPGKLEVIRSYLQAISYVHAFCDGRKSALQCLIRALAEARGLPQRFGDKQAIAFFA
jgi:hypothetical protein